MIGHQAKVATKPASPRQSPTRPSVILDDLGEGQVIKNAHDAEDALVYKQPSKDSTGLMTFSSIPFLFYFFPLFLAAYFASPKGNTGRNLALLGASLIFYAWGEPFYIFLLLASIAINHGIGVTVAKTSSRQWLFLGVGVNLLILGVAKYAGFALSGVGAALSIFGLPAPSVPDITLPLGISFYTFQAISFLIDQYRKDAPPPQRFTDTALYIAMFPQLIAGPIVRYKTIADEIQNRTHSLEKFSAGARVFVLGLAQKTLLANIFAETADAAFTQAGASALSAGAAWAGLGAYSFQIYFDFAGYSNMAIGMGLMMGFHLPRNFNFPYASLSITEFWRRWHMTLSNWFRDYLYIPLGGNRGGALKTYRNLWIVFILCGLWHGAAIAFVFWGAYHGALLVIERQFLANWLEKTPILLRRVYLLLAAAIGWVPFRTEDMGEALQYYAAMAGLNDTPSHNLSDIALEGMSWVFLIGAIAALWPAFSPIHAWLQNHTQRHQPLRWASAGATEIALGALLIIAASSLAAGAYNPFIYFRF